MVSIREVNRVVSIAERRVAESTQKTKESISIINKIRRNEREI